MEILRTTLASPPGKEPDAPETPFGRGLMVIVKRTSNGGCVVSLPVEAERLKRNALGEREDVVRIVCALDRLEPRQVCAVVGAREVDKGTVREVLI